MVDIHLGHFTPWQARLASAFFNLRGPSTRFVFGCEERDPMLLPFSENRVTSDENRYARNIGYLKAQPFLRICGPTFGWLNAALKSTRLMRRTEFTSSVITPLLIFGAEKDEVVVTEAVRDFAKHAPNARYVEIPEARHEILQEKDSMRAIFWQAFDAFVAEQLAQRRGGAIFPGR
jgi:lysophospholipase